MHKWLYLFLPMETHFTELNYTLNCLSILLHLYLHRLPSIDNPTACRNGTKTKVLITIKVC